MLHSSRRRFIAGLGAASVSGLLPGISGAAIGGNSAAVPVDAAASGEYMLEPGLIHLNTGTLGAMPRTVFERTVEAMRRFERNPPVQAYKFADDTLLGEAERERARCAAFLGCTADELLITHGTADALGQVAGAIDLQPGERILTSGAEHDSGVFCWRWLARRHGGFIDTVPIAPEELDTYAIVRRFAEAIRPETKVLCVSDVIAWTGLRLPIRALSDLAHAHGLLMVVDGAQAVGQVPVDVAALGCDAYAASGHKWLLGPKGTGFLYVRADPAERLRPVAWEDSKRLNSEAMGACALPLAIGLGAAVAHLQERTLAAVQEHNVALRNRLHESLRTLPGVTPVGPPPGPQATALVAFRLPDKIDAGTLRTALFENHRINMRAVDKKQFNGLRASLHVYNSQAQVEALMSALQEELS